MTTAISEESVTSAARGTRTHAREPMPRIDEQRMRTRLAARDERAFAEVVETFGPPLRAVALRILPREEDAEDALQDAWISAWRHLDGFDGHSRLSTWLYRITVNAALMRRRAMRRRPAIGLEQAFGVGAPDERALALPAADQPPVDAPAQQAERRARLLEAIGHLPPAYRTVVALRDLAELDTRETARRLGLREAAVKTRLHRARRALRALLAPAPAALETPRAAAPAAVERPLAA